MKLLFKIVTLISFISFISAVNAQSIINIEPYVKGNTIELHYVVKGLKLNQTLDVSLYVSRDGGASFQGPMVEVSGDIGRKIFNGPHSITWEATKEMPLENANIVFDVRGKVVNAKIDRHYFMAYAGNNVTPIGFRFGTLGGIGWYVSALSNTNPFLTGSYTYKDGILTDYTRFAWYEFTGEHKVSAYMTCGGITWQLAPNLFLYGGAGYGKEETLYEINEYSYDGDAYLGKDYAIDYSESASGIAAEAGLIFRTGKIVFSGGASTVAFSRLYWQAGIGYSF